MHRQWDHSTIDLLYQTASLNYPLWVSSPWTLRIYVPTTFNPDQTQLNSALELHIGLCHFHWQKYQFEHRWCINITPKFSSDFWVGPLFLIQFDSPFLILLTISISLYYYNLILLIFSDIIWLNCLNLVRLKLQTFDSQFPIQLSFSVPIWLIIYNSIQCIIYN